MQAAWRFGLLPSHAGEEKGQGMSDWKKDMLKFRAENFAVKVAVLRSPIEGNEVALSITHNGFQWHTIALRGEEVDAVIKALTNYKKKRKAKE